MLLGCSINKSSSTSQLIKSKLINPINSLVTSAILWTTFWKQFLHHLVQFL